MTAIETAVRVQIGGLGVDSASNPLAAVAVDLAGRLDAGQEQSARRRKARRCLRL
jgi:hypothetical protein